MKVMLSATEVSGDMHGANLVHAIRKFSPDSVFFGLGGEKMKEAGVELKAFTTHLGTVGIAEGVRFYPLFFKLFFKAKKVLQEERPDVLVLIDSRDFNVNLINPARKLNIPVVYYVAPPIWAFPDTRMKKMVDKINKVIAFFPFEADSYRKIGADVALVGHPLVDLVKVEKKREEICRELRLDPSLPIISLLPGSRIHEVKNLLPLMLSAAERLNHKLREVQYLLCVAASFLDEKIRSMLDKRNLRVRVVGKKVYEAMSVSDLVIASSGTATLEATCLEVPMIILYRTHILTYLLARMLIRVPYVGLPNLLAGEEIVPELLQFKLTEESLAEKVFELLETPEKREKIKNELKKVKEKLGPPGAMERAARVVLEVAVSKKRRYAK
ncbi:lipid-A-disaccharide synthase [Candidatus Aerophobetes bacterium]|nr:lipid-A-disaccharide synthase [Candidatus Aerophobetes bacterium]